MPEMETPDGHSMWAPDWYTDEQRERYAYEYDRMWCEDCENSPCDCNCYTCDYARDECRCCGDCECFPCECEPDYDDEVDDSLLLSYSYEPPDGYTFHGQGPAFYGMEIEISSDNGYDTITYAKDVLDTDHGTLGYLKSDSSVRGFELVTPPMSYEFAMNEFPWHLLPDLRERGCTAVYDDNGIHVHVSRAAFSNPTHVYRWMKLIYRNRSNVERIARRSSWQWAKFDDDHRAGQFHHCKTKNREWDDTKETRYSAINTQNSATFEVRVFASTLSVTKAKRCLQLVAASVEYTRQLTSSKISGSDAAKSWSWEAFTEWLIANQHTYPELADSEARELGALFTREGSAL